MSVSINSARAPATQHVPAWKRLGLKLKFAKDTVEPVIRKNGAVETATNKRSVDIDETEPVSTPSKKRKTHTEHTEQSIKVATTESKPDRRKSVAFTADTKGEASSSQRVYPDLTIDETSSGSAEPAVVTPSLAKPEKTKKRPKLRQADIGINEASDQSKANAHENTVPKTPLDYVNYLQQYHSDRQNWKFNKNKQKDLLKNLFNVYRIPSEHDPALAAYISGLQGLAAQHRVIEDAEEILKKLMEKQGRSDELDGVGSPTGRKELYEAALQREIETMKQTGTGQSELDEQQLQELRQEIARSKRADALLTQLLAKELGPAVSQSSLADSYRPDTNNPPTRPAAIVSSVDTAVSKPKRKKRKARTEISSSDESSSSSDSSSSESDSEDDLDQEPVTVQEALPTRPIIAKAQKALGDTTSSTQNAAFAPRKPAFIPMAADKGYGFATAAKPSGKRMTFDETS